MRHPTDSDHRIFEFGGYRLDVAERRLIGADARAIQLTARLFDLLLFMLERPGRLLPRQTLLDGVWRGVIVEENSLSQAVSALRRLLGDARSERRYIETVPGVGYRFIAPVSLIRAQAPAAGAALSSAAEIELRPQDPVPAAGLAPFPTGRTRSWLGMLIAAGTAAIAIIAVMALLSTRGALSFTSNSPSPERGVVVGPSASQSGASEQDPLAPLSSEPGMNPAIEAGWDTEVAPAFDRFELATDRLRRGGPENASRAVELLNEAVTLDPTFGRAWAELARAYTAVAITGGRPRGEEAKRLGDEALDRALTLAPNAIEALALEADRVHARRDWHGVARTAARLDALDPPDEPQCSRVATFEFGVLGRGMARSAVCAAAWMGEERLSLQVSAVAQFAFSYGGRNDLADDEYLRSLDLAGDRSAVEMMALGRLWTDGERAALPAQMRRVVDVWPVPMLEQLFAVFDDRDAALAVLRAAAGDSAYADGPGQVMLASWLDRYDDPAGAAEALYRAFVEHNHSLFAPLYTTSPAVRREPRYKQLLVALGLVDYWRETGLWSDFCRPLGSDDFNCAD